MYSITFKIDGEPVYFVVNENKISEMLFTRPEHWVLEGVTKCSFLLYEDFIAMKKEHNADFNYDLEIKKDYNNDFDCDLELGA